MGFTRRDFIKIMGGGAAAAAVATSLPWSDAEAGPVADPATDGETVVPSMCEICFWKCGILAHVRNGRVTKIVGNPAHPLSGGRLCPRGTGGVGLIYDPDRLQKPLLRVGRKTGQQKFEEVSWSKALDVVAENLERVRDKHGPEALAFFTHGHGGSWFQHLVSAYGSPNAAMPSYAQCKGPRDTAFSLTYGYPVGSPERTDLANARCITLIGSHLGENMHNTQVQHLAEAIGKGADLVVVDPRFSVAAGKARYWLPIKPGTDLALLLAWISVIIEEGLYDRAYVEKYATGFDELKKHVQDKTPEWAYPYTTIRPEVIRETARFIAGSRPASLIHPGRHVTWDGNDTQRLRAVAILNALLGAWGHRGGFFIPSKTRLAEVPVPAYPKPRRPAADAPKGGGYPFAEEGLASGLRDATIPGTAAYDIKAWLVYGTNLIQSLPEPAKTVQALQAADFVAVVDVLPAEITGYADVVLPEAVYLERHDDLHNPGWLRPYVALRQPVVPPTGEAKPGWWIARELGLRLDLAAFFPWKDADDYLALRARASGLDLAELHRTGVVLGPAGPTCIEEGAEPTFDTPSKKIELFSKQMAESGLPPLPVFIPPQEPPAGAFRLLSGRSPVHTFGRTTNNRFLGQVDAGNQVWLNARSAADLGLKNGDMVQLTNQDGVKSEPVRLKATQRIRPDCAYMVHGWGHEDRRLRFAFGRGASDSRLVTRQKTDAATGCTGMNVNFVTVERWQA